MRKLYVTREVNADPCTAGTTALPAPGLAIYTQNKTSDVDPRVQRMDITKLNPEQCTVRLDMLQYCINGVWHSLFSDAVYAAMARELILAFAASPAGRTVVTSPEIFDAKVVVMAKKVEEAMHKHRGASCPAYFNQTVTVGNKGQDHAVTLRILNRKPTAGPHAGFDVIATALPNLDTSFEVRQVRSLKEIGLNRLVPSDSAGAGVKRMAHSLLAQNTETAYEARAMAEQVRRGRRSVNPSVKPLCFCIDMCRFVSIFYILRFTERPSLQVRSGRRSVNPSVKPSVICVDLCLFFTSCVSLNAHPCRCAG